MRWIHQVSLIIMKENQFAFENVAYEAMSKIE